MHKNYKLDEQVTTSLIRRHVKPIEHQKLIKLIIYDSKYKMSNVIVENKTSSPKLSLIKFRECLSENNITANAYVGYTTTTLSRRLIYHLLDISAIKQHLMTEHDKDIDKLKSIDIKKILINTTKIIYENNNKNRLLILETITTRN